MNTYQPLITMLNESDSILNDLLSCTKEDFSADEKKINIAIGIMSELREILFAINEELFVVNKDLYNVVISLKKYSGTLFNNYKMVNSYKIYDCLIVDLAKLKSFFN